MQEAVPLRNTWALAEWLRMCSSLMAGILVAESCLGCDRELTNLFHYCPEHTPIFAMKSAESTLHSLNLNTVWKTMMVVLTDLVCHPPVSADRLRHMPSPQPQLPHLWALGNRCVRQLAAQLVSRTHTPTRDAHLPMHMQAPTSTAGLLVAPLTLTSTAFTASHLRDPTHSPADSLQCGSAAQCDVALPILPPTLSGMAFSAHTATPMASPTLSGADGHLGSPAITSCDEWAKCAE